MIDQKKCFKCDTIQPHDAFYKSSRTKDGLRSQCKGCEHTNQRQWRKKNPSYCSEYQREWDKNHLEAKKDRLAKQRIERKANAHARRLTLLGNQEGKCKICGTENPGDPKGWHLDHDHRCCDKPIEQSCGRCDRGVLCFNCNVNLVGRMEKNRHLISILLEYLGTNYSEMVILDGTTN